MSALQHKNKWSLLQVEAPAYVPPRTQATLERSYINKKHVLRNVEKSDTKIEDIYFKNNLTKRENMLKEENESEVENMNEDNRNTQDWKTVTKSTVKHEACKIESLTCKNMHDILHCNNKDTEKGIEEKNNKTDIPCNAQINKWKEILKKRSSQENKK